MDLLRTFIGVAVPCPAALRPVVRSLGEMGNALRPVAPDNLHLTLKFLGDTPAEQIGEVTGVLNESAAGIAPFEFDVVGIGAFPSLKRPGVVWSGVVRGEPLVTIAERLAKRLKKLGYSKERRPFSPHLTLARVRHKPPQLLFDLFEQHAAMPFGTVAVGEVTFYQSELRPEGSKYTELSSVELQNDVQL
jgi:RNA 2',3'-cyclic 3'-phosphodiesterase